MSDIIQVQDLTKFYGPALAVDHISFDIKEGEVFGFLGPNGAGKTTTIRVLVGLTEPSSGAAWVDSRDVAKESVEVKKTTDLVPHASNADKTGASMRKELKIVCQSKSGCTHPENLKGEPKDCSAEQIAICHSGEEGRICESEESAKK
jgi:ABC-type multidrug transport system ATPase subunit